MTGQAGDTGHRPRRRRLANRFRVWRCLRGARTTRFVTPPEPRLIGSEDRGHNLVAGRFLLDGDLVEADCDEPWTLEMPSVGFEAALHGFRWLDDLVAAGDTRALDLARSWTAAWMRRFGTGRGAGWTVDLTGARLLRWVLFGGEVAPADQDAARPAFFRLLSAQTDLVATRWHTGTPGPARIETLAGLIAAGCVLEGKQPVLPGAAAALARACEDVVAPDGSIPSRNPEQLVDLFAHLVLSRQMLGEHGAEIPSALDATLARIAPVLRMLRQPDGAMARFQGGGRGRKGRLDQALVGSGIRPGAMPASAMGYRRLTGGRTSVIVDAAGQTPDGLAASDSALAFELTSGWQPLVVNCGPGAEFGASWGKQSREPQSHSGLVPAVKTGAGRIEATLHEDLRVRRLVLSRDVTGDGRLVHLRGLTLTRDGFALLGEDRLDSTLPNDIDFALHFHLHPDVAAEQVDPQTVWLQAGDLHWQVRFDGAATMSLASSVYHETGQRAPRATRQILISGKTSEGAARLNWTLRKAQDTPHATGDAADARTPPE